MFHHIHLFFLVSLEATSLCLCILFVCLGLFHFTGTFNIAFLTTVSAVYVLTPTLWCLVCCIPTAVAGFACCSQVNSKDNLCTWDEAPSCCVSRAAISIDVLISIALSSVSLGLGFDNRQQSFLDSLTYGVID